MDFLAVYEAMVTCGGTPPFASRIKEMRHHFEERTGRFGPDDPWFEVRIRAFWDDALTTQGLATTVASATSGPLRQAILAWTRPLARAHRGLFHAERGEDGWKLVDRWSGAEFVVGMPDPGLHEALQASALLDGRVVARDNPMEIALLPGALFHPEDATDPIGHVLDAAHERGMVGGDTLDALLRMERNLRSHARVKASYAYRPENLVGTSPRATLRKPFKSP
ncbi:hypothetical protein [Pendulispora albinea]|uniref:Uncharacterized protein n=1 Tax=Pendulispora albinea TaxID=2741071 RepID=A0ABZ2M0A1_9BACT